MLGPVDHRPYPHRRGLELSGGLRFVAEAALLATSGGAAGAVLGGFATTVYAARRHWSATVPLPVLFGAVGIALVVGATAGLYPALRATRLAPAEALRII